MRIALIHPHFTYLGGSSRFVLEISKQFVSKGVDVTIITQRSYGTVLKTYRNLSIVNISGHLPKSLGFWLSIPKLQQKVIQAVRFFRPNVVIPNAFPSNYFLRPNVVKCPVVWYCHDPAAFLYDHQAVSGLKGYMRWITETFRFPLRIYDKHVVRTFDDVICNSHYTASIVKRIYNREFKVVHGGVDAKLFRPKENHTAKTNKKTILTVGALIKRKRIDYFLRAIKLLSQMRNDFKVLIVGDGEEKANLLSLVNDLQIDNLVRFCGFITDSELLDVYSESYMVVHPAIHEPFGIVPLEAMAMEKPVIGCVGGGPAETIVDGKTGYVVPPHGIDCLVEAMDTLLSNESMAKEMGKRGREHVQHDLSWSITADKILKIIEKLL